MSTLICCLEMVDINKTPEGHRFEARGTVTEYDPSAVPTPVTRVTATFKQREL